MQTKIQKSDTYSLKERTIEIKDIGMQKKNTYPIIRFIFLIIASFFWFGEYLIISVRIISDFSFLLVFILLLSGITTISYYFYKINLLYIYSFPFSIYLAYVDKKYDNIKEWFFETLMILEQINDLKSCTLKIDKELSELISKDIHTHWVDVDYLELMKNLFSELQESILLYTKKIDALKEKKERFSQSFKKKTSFINIINNIIFNEEKFVLTTNTTNYKRTKSWISHHQSELKELEKDIQTQTNTTQSTDWKVALDLQSKRLQSYINSLKEITQ